MDWLLAFGIGMVVMYAGCLVAGMIGSGVAMGIADYNALRGGWYGFSRLALGNLISTLFAFFGLFPILTYLGWFWAVLIYGMIWFATVNWVNVTALQSANKLAAKVSGVPK